MKYLRILFNKKIALFETSKNIEPIKIFEMNGRRMFCFNRNIYFDSESQKGRTKNVPENFIQVWMEIEPNILTYCGGMEIVSLEQWVENMSKVDIEPRIEDLKEALSDISKHNRQIDKEVEQRKIERLKREEQKRLEEEKSQKRFEEYILKSEELYKKGEYIQSDALEEIFKKYNIKVPLRTLGWIRRSLIEIRKDGSFKFRGKSYSESIARLRMELNSKLKECLG